jgi:hypothetical protein
MNDKAAEIVLLYFEGCPSYRRAWGDILEALVEERIDANVRPVAVEDAETAERLHFAGSPSILINGRDLEDYRGPGTMACRVYAENGGKGWPSKHLIARRLRKAIAGSPPQ